MSMFLFGFVCGVVATGLYIMIRLAKKSDENQG